MDEQEFKPFYETYKKITFALSVCMIYPNPSTEKYRLAAIPLMVGSITPLGILVLQDIYRSWQESDMVNILRHSTVLGPFLGGFFKMFLMYRKRIEAKEILDEISHDHLRFNEFGEKYKQITRASIRNAQIYSETSWVVLVIFVVMTFPGVAIALNVYNCLFEDEPKKYMIHDIRILNWDPEKKFQSPYYEIFFVHSFYCALLYVVTFIGYDGFFGISINHACLKMDLFCSALEDAMSADHREIYGRVVCVIKEQCKMFHFVELIQDTFNFWLGLILVATMIQICTCLYQITEGYGFDVRYVIFVLGSVAHIYVPCRYGAKLKAMSMVTATKIYCCGWENVDNLSVRKLIVLMIARAQVPNEVNAFTMVPYDMELFLSILQTSYSMFTLLRS